MDYNLPWVEKYRPHKLSEIVGQDKIVTSLTKMFNGGSFPHLLFYGGSGSGKTSTIMALAKEIYGQNVRLMVMKLDASDDRGINSVREDTKGFAEKSNMFQKGVRLIILDEADSMTFDAQFALRRIIEKYSSSTRFCLICNYDNKIIPAIKSRCAEFKFNPISQEHIITKLKHVADSENLSYDKSAFQVLSNIAKGDLRKAINLMQSASSGKDDMKQLNAELCYNIAGYPKPNEIKKISDMLFDDSKTLEVTSKKFRKYITENGYSISIILKEIIEDIVCRISDGTINPKEYCYILSELAGLESKVSKSTFGDIYLSMLISIFKK